MFMKLQMKLLLHIVVIIFLVFLAVSIYGATLGLSTDCGCFGAFIKSELSWGMVIKNLIFLFMVTYLIFMSMNIREHKQ